MKDDIQRGTHRNSLLSAFPSKKSFIEFKKEDIASNGGKSFPKFIQYAVKCGLIKSQKETGFISFIENNSLDFNELETLPDLNFVKIIEELIGVHSVNRLIMSINKIASDFKIPKFKASMFTRLRKDYHINTFRKRQLIRILAFYIGNKHNQIVWNYETLIKLPRQISPDITAEEEEGIQISFSLQGPGSTESEVLDWLKSEVKNAIKELKLFHLYGKNISIDTTTITLNLPKQKGSSGELRLYSRSVFDAFAMSHHISVKWDLSGHNTIYRSLVISISGGLFKTLDKTRSPLLLKKISKKQIRLTEFVLQCSRIADLHVVFEKIPEKFETLDGIEFNVYTVTFFWFRYFDFIQVLLREDMLPLSREHLKTTKKTITPDERMPGTHGLQFKALAVLRKSPHNALLGIEIAKVLMAREMNRESNAVLSTILASDPNHLGARIFKIMNLMSLGFSQTNLSVFLSFFRLAREESIYLKKYCTLDEESMVEIGLIYYGKALYILHYVRENYKKLTRDNPKYLDTLIDEVFSSFKKAERHFEKAAVLSQAGIVPAFWIIYTKSFHDLLEQDGQIFQNKNSITDEKNVFKKNGLVTLFVFGFIDNSISDIISIKPEELAAILEKLNRSIQTYTNSVFLKSLIPTIYFSISMVIWDFFPLMTLKIANLVLNFLDEARSSADELKKYTVGGFSVSSCYFRVQPPEQIISCIDKAEKTIRKIIGKQIKNQDTHTPILHPDVSKIKLMLLNFNEEIKQKHLL